MLQNGSFSEGWETLPPIVEANFLRNQRPHGWQVEWQAMGEPLYADPGTKVRGIPECVHKLSKQLPKNEQLGGKNALILEGNAVYKIFSGGAEFGATLSQTVTGLQPNSQARLVVPIQVHKHGDTDIFGAESGVWVNGEGDWAHSEKMGDRKWYKHKIDFTVPDNGQAQIIIRVKSKWRKPKDFFFDGITLEAKEATTPPVVDPEPPVATKTVFVQLPQGVEIKQGVCDEENVVEVNVGPGVKVEIV